MEEHWLPVKGYEGLYEISDWGRVKSLNYRGTGKEQILHQTQNKSGYMYVPLHKDGKTKSCRVHRLVAEAFVPNPNNLPEVNHIDENKQNNRSENLEWCDRLSNVRHGTGIERSRASHSIAIEQVDMTGNVVKEWVSSRDAERNGYHSGAIIACCKGKKRSYKGYFWRYADK